MSRAARIGLVTAAVMIAVIVLLAVVSRLGGSSTPAATPTSQPAPSVEPTDAPAISATGPVATESPVPSTDPDVDPLPDLPETNDPDAYAVAIAEVVLGLDFRDRDREDYLTLLFSEIPDDVEEEDRARVESVIETWLPEEFQWQRQRDYAQVNAFTAESVWVPEIAEDNAADIPSEYKMRTVAGAQSTEFLDENDELATSTTPRLVTVLMYCPSGGVCSLFSIPQEVQR